MMIKTLEEWEVDFPRLSDEIVRDRIEKLCKKATEAGLSFDLQGRSSPKSLIEDILKLSDEDIRNNHVRWIGIPHNVDSYLTFENKNRSIKIRLWNIFHMVDEDFERHLTRF